MLSIVLGILKVIGILLLILLGFVLAILLAVLFVPLRYEAEGKKTAEDLSGSGCVSWLLHSIRLTGSYDHRGFRAKLKLFGITVKSIGASEKKRKEEGNGKGRGKKAEIEGEEAEGRTSESEAWERPEGKREESEARERPEGKREESEAWEGKRAESEAWKGPEDRAPERGDSEEREFDGGEMPFEHEKGWEDEDTLLYPMAKKEKSGFWKSFHPIRSLSLFLGRLWQILTALWEFIITLPSRVWELWWKISELLDEGESRGEALREGWESLKKKAAPFLQQEARTVYKRLLEHLRYLLRACGPRKIKGWLRLGTGAPDVTGALAGAVYLILPACAEEFSFQPDFQEQILEGDIVIKGRIQVWCLAKTGFLLWRDQELRNWIRKVRAKGGQSNGR